MWISVYFRFDWRLPYYGYHDTYECPQYLLIVFRYLNYSCPSQEGKFWYTLLPRVWSKDMNYNIQKFQKKVLIKMEIITIKQTDSVQIYFLLLNGCYTLCTICSIFRSTYFHSRVLMGFVLLGLRFSMLCFVYYIFRVCFLMTLSVYFRLMSLNVPFIFFAIFLFVYKWQI